MTNLKVVEIKIIEDTDIAYWRKRVESRIAQGNVKMSGFCAAQLAHVALNR